MASSAQQLEAELKAKLEAFQKAFRSGTDDEKRQALADFFVTKEQVEVLFPKDAVRIWDLYGRVRKRYLEHIDEVENAPPPLPVEINLIDVRKQSGSRYGKVLTMLPKNVPVYRARFEHAGGSSKAGSYLKVKDRWCWFDGLETVPDFLEGKLNLGRVK